MRILSVDDSRSIRLIIKNAVDVLGFDFLEAGDGREAWQVLEQEQGKLDLILLDWNMPVMDGFELLQKLKADDRFKGIPVIMVSTEGERGRVIDAIRVGAKNYVIKPFTQEELAGKILESLGMAL